uniref:Uncharacterized protein n=1 Tax=Arundo donax TaxID=35708 RepID=A0A0A8Z4X4_ARUDO
MSETVGLVVVHCIRDCASAM